MIEGIVNIRYEAVVAPHCRGHKERRVMLKPL